MKKLIGIMLICMAVGCQKAELVERAEAEDGRNAPNEKTDSVYVSPEFEAEGWEGAVDAEFTF